MSTELAENRSWNLLESFPFISFSQPFVINNNEFVVASSKSSCINADGIYKFNIHTNKWIKIFNYDTNFVCYIHSAACDNENKLLYCSSKSTMLTFDLKKNKVTLKHQPNKLYFELIFVNNQLHQICNSTTFNNNTVQAGDHYVYDATNQLQKLTTFLPLKNLAHYGLIYLKSQKSLLLFGGYDSIWVIQNSIYQFSCADSKWEELNIKMPNKLSEFGLVATTNERYIILLGGMTIGYEKSDNIFIYDAKNNIFTKSKIKCPTKGIYYAIIMNNSKRDEIATFGFVNDSYKTQKFDGVQPLPQYLVKIICCYFCHEEIYLLGKGNGKHWKINVDHILQ